MAEISVVGYATGKTLATSPAMFARTLETYVDFTATANQVAAAADSINLFELPAGTVVLTAGVEQVVAGSAGSTAIARAGTVALSGSLASDAAVGTITAHADVTGGAPMVLTTATKFNLLIGTAVRATGRVRAFAVVLEGDKPQPAPGIAARDTSV